MALVLDGAPSGAHEQVVAGRYRIEARLAKGGMGAVYRAFDQVTQRALALKRLSASDDRRRLRMFEREFHTLAGLKHPRIIEVYDYGLDEHGAYYTMELLDGVDLREIAPLPFETACRYLRDVASSLALLHARNLLHRDLSPRNVRITTDGHAKLLDFGALSSFGKSATVVGTAPCVAPEALHGAQLDQRTDLYALGALAYWVLSGRHAYDVRAISELTEAFRKPPPPAPSTLVRQRPDLPAIPEALDDLVLALLSQNPLARPSSAAEVIARLSAIACLPPAAEPLSALSYLHGGASVGRSRERARLRKRVKSALAGTGSVVWIDAEAGMGSARLLSELATEGRLLGMAAVVIDAGGQRTTYGVAEQIARALLAAHPEKAHAALRDDADELARFLPDADAPTASRRIDRPSERSKIDPREGRLRTQAALLSWIERLARELPLLIAVRGFQDADDSSAALLSALGSGIGSQRALLVVACDPDAAVAAPAAHAALRQTAKRITLRGLSREEVGELVETTFGSVPNTERLAGWLHELTQGKPRACFELLQHLIEHDVIRFLDGAWSLPQELAPHELPSDLGQALELRFERSSPEAKRLSFALCVERGPVPIERALAMAGLERIPSPFRALSELEQRGVLVADDEHLRFSNRLMRDAVLRRLDDTERARLHAQLGALIAREGNSDQNALLDAGWHLLHGGEARRGADLLAQAGLALSLHADGMPAAIPALEAALAAYRAQGRSRAELASLLGALAIAGFYTDRRVVEAHGDAAVRLLSDVLGLSTARRLRPLFGPRLALWIGLCAGITRCAFAHGPRRARRAYLELLTLFITAGVVMTGLGTLTLDGPRARRYAEMLEPLEGFGSDHAATLNLRFAHALASLPEDRVAQTLEATREILARLEAASPIRDLARRARDMMLSAALYAYGSLETFRENPEALAVAERLEAMGSKHYEMLANQIRANYHGLRGEEALALQFRRRVELFAMQAGASWQGELWNACSAILCYMLTADVVGLGRVASELERLSEDIPSLRTHAQLARSVDHMVRGEFERAHGLGHAVFSAVEPRGFIGWGPNAAGEIRCIAALGDPERALSLGLRVLSLYDAADRAVTTMFAPILIEVALVEAELGRVEEAADRLDEFLAELGARGGPATRGGLHEARARVALAAGDPQTARVHFGLMEHAFEPTANPALIARCERLRRELDGSEPHGSASASDTLDLGLSPTELVRRALLGCKDRESLLKHALELLLEHSGARAGALFECRSGELVPGAWRGDAELPAAVTALALEEARLYADGEVRTAATTATTDAPSETKDEETTAAARYRVCLLAAPDGSRGELVAVAALSRGPQRGRTPPRAMLTAIAEALAEAAERPTRASR